MGPSAIACDDDGNIYVGIFDLRESSREGKVVVLSPSGALKATIKTFGAEISGLVFREGNLYITERSGGCVLKCNLEEMN